MVDVLARRLTVAEMWDWAGMMVEGWFLFGCGGPIADQNWRGGWR